VNVDKVVLAAPRGFCAGVEKAIKALDWMTRVFASPVFCYHEIVHNQFVVDYFKSVGVVFIDDVTLVPSRGAGHVERARVAPRGDRRRPAVRVAR
jgi:4-hydroxy-3-methylbut-2-enyl diphosphate reductase